jgi:carbonic anhydrase/acetyltransferase-like protein (isoleucine patch superfamily)
MDKTLKKPLARLGYDFIPSSYLPQGENEFYIRDRQFGKGARFRALTAHEIEVLVKNDNKADSWNDITVGKDFDPNRVKNCHFHGRIRIGALQPFFLEFHDLKLPVGLYNSTIVSCDISDNVVIKNVDYLAHYIIGNEVILFNINEMHSTNHAKFGNGILKEGEPESVRIHLEICNENGGRSVLPFDGMLPADAWLWAKFRDDEELMDRLLKMTDAEFDVRRGYYGTIGDRCVIKNTRILKDVKIGTDAYIKGGNKLKNLTINSSAEAPSQIGEGVEMVNGILGYGSRSFYGVKAVRFVMGENTTLKYGARLINSLLGDNSTISCCEVLNSLIFPAHEQHHNNSFLVAATVMGQSNIAAGATIGSNHNSRGADGEIIAGRGFWPGLSVSLKHNSRFASFCLLVRGSYPAELNIPLPFALISNNDHADCLHVLPAFWWLYNMYALARNAWKYEARDKRNHRHQLIEYDFLAPDTVAELFEGVRVLETATARAYRRKFPEDSAAGGNLAQLGKHLLTHKTETVEQLLILGENMENTSREVRIFKVPKAYRAYRDMLHYYGIKTLVKYGEANGRRSWEQLRAHFSGSQRVKWVNLGGQLLPQSSLTALRKKIREGIINSWQAVHQQYHKFHQDYEEQNVANAFATLLELYDLPETEVNEEIWKDWLDEAVRISHEMADKTRESRQKDYANPYRKMVYETLGEMQSVLGNLDDNDFIQRMEEEAERFEATIGKWLPARRTRQPADE